MANDLEAAIGALTALGMSSTNKNIKEECETTISALTSYSQGAERCCRRWFTDGGRSEEQCPNLADVVCKTCGKAYCDECLLDEAFDSDKMLCEDCQ